mmetsp:Transcript_27227/g.49809  ORF Transcript_27227/g.49809 Transcript_27227/m.49809 type:complete len:269 (+) Transcript_27227:1753-2559(+)
MAVCLIRYACSWPFVGRPGGRRQPLARSEGHLELFKLCPIEVYTDARLVGRDGEAILDHEWALGIAINGKAVDLKPSAMRLRRHQRHVKFLHPMAANGHIVALCHLRHLQPAGDAKAVGRVWLDEIHMGQGAREFVHSVQVFTLRHGHAGGFADFCEILEGVRNNWLFEPCNVLGFESVGHGNRLVDRHGIIRINHKGRIRPDEFTHGPDPLQIFGLCRLADLDLDRAHAPIKVTLDAIQQLGQVKAKVNPARIGAAPVRRAACRLHQ